ncbi:MAG: hypothetical protein ACK58T_42915, partial [Phycisphaerae bacterium]
LLASVTSIRAPERRIELSLLHLEQSREVSIGDRRGRRVPACDVSIPWHVGLKAVSAERSQNDLRPQ